MKKPMRIPITRQQAEKLFDFNQTIGSEYHRTGTDIRVTIHIKNNQDLLVIFNRQTYKPHYYLVEK